MKVRAYPENYLNKAQRSLGDAFDFAINDCGIASEEFVRLFVASSGSKKFQCGDPSFLAGRSGIEMAMDVLEETTGKEYPYNEELRLGRSVEYWIGWAIAYYQWYSDRSFMEIFDAVSFVDLERLYVTLHEADTTKFAEVMEERFFRNRETNLKKMRQLIRWSQAKLSRESGVSLRSIQMYEQRRKDINKAAAETLYALAKTIGCRMEDLLEKGSK